MKALAALAILALLAALVVFLVGGCGLVPVNPAAMTATVNDQSASLRCVTVETPYRGNSITINLERFLAPGIITIDRQCNITIRIDGVTEEIPSH